MSAFVLGFTLAGIGWSIYAAAVGRTARRLDAKRRHPASARRVDLDAITIRKGRWI